MMTTMVVATTTLAVATPPLKRGRPQFASLEMLSPSGLKGRRARAKNKAKKQLAKLEEEGLDACQRQHTWTTAFEAASMAVPCTDDTVRERPDASRRDLPPSEATEQAQCRER